MSNNVQSTDSVAQIEQEHSHAGTARVANLIQTKQSGLAQFFQVLKIIRGPLIISLFAFMVLAMPGQMHELYRALAESIRLVLENDAHRRDPLMLLKIATPFLALALMSLVLWYVTRYLTLVLQNSASSITGLSRGLLQLAPGIIGAVPTIGVALGVLIASVAAQPGTQIAFAMLVIAIMVVTALSGRFKPQFRRLIAIFKKRKSGGQYGSILWHGAKLVLMIVVALAALSVIAFFEYRYYIKASSSKNFDLYLIFFVFILIATVFVAVSYHRLEAYRAGRHIRKPLLASPWAHLLFFGMITLFVVAMTLNPIKLSQYIGTISIFSLFVIVLSFVVVQLTCISDRIGLPLLTLLVVYAVALSMFDLNDNHIVRDVADKPLTRASVNDLGAPSIENQFTEWFENRADRARYGGKTYPVYIVAAQGGGLYAAHHSAMFLSRMQDLCENFAQHVFAISSVSGGSLGAATFAGLAKVAKNAPSPPPCKTIDPRWDFGFKNMGSKPIVERDGTRIRAAMSFQFMAHNILNSDFLSPLAFSTLFPDFLARFLPYPFPKLDRSRALEDAFAEAWIEGKRKLGERFEYQEGLARNFGLADPDGSTKAWDSLSDPFNESFLKNWTADGSVPALLINTTGVGTGIPWIISPFDMDDGVSRRNFPLWAERVDEANERKETTSRAQMVPDIPLKQAVSLSARFPWLTAPGTIYTRHEGRRQGSIRLADGGYFENSGVDTALHVIEQISEIKQEIETKYGQKFRINLIVLTNSGARRVPKVATTFSETLAPIRALMNTRAARSTIVIAQAKRELDTYRIDCSKSPQDDPKACVRRVRQVKLNAKGIPLGWLLSNRSREIIWKQLGNHHRCRPNQLFDDENGRSEPDCVQLSIMHELDGKIDDVLIQMTRKRRELIARTNEILTAAEEKLAQIRQGGQARRTPNEVLENTEERQRFLRCVVSSKIHDNPLSESSIDGYHALLNYRDNHIDTFADQRWLAYALALANKATTGAMSPAENPLVVKRRRSRRSYRTYKLTGKKYYPRGYERFTGPASYRKFGTKARLGLAPYREPDLLLVPDIAAQIFFESRLRRLFATKIEPAKGADISYYRAFYDIRGKRTRTKWYGPKIWQKAKQVTNTPSFGFIATAENAQKYYECLASDAKDDQLRGQAITAVEVPTYKRSWWIF